MSKVIQLLKEQTNDKQVNEMNEASEMLVEYEEIENTPFTGIKQNDKWTMVMGNFRVSEKEFESIEVMKEYINEKPWKLMMVASSIFHEMRERNEFNDKRKKK